MSLFFFFVVVVLVVVNRLDKSIQAFDCLLDQLSIVWFVLFNLLKFPLFNCQSLCWEISTLAIDMLVVSLNKRCSYGRVRGVSVDFSRSNIHWMSTNHCLVSLTKHCIWNTLKLKDSCVTEWVTECWTQFLKLLGLEQLFKNIRKFCCDCYLSRPWPPNILCTSFLARFDKRKNIRSAETISKVVMRNFCFFAT
jgi:hypothetical protein